MPSEPRKLPVIQVATLNNGGVLATDKDGFGLFHQHDNMGQFELGFALYEPAVPRCATCPSFETPAPPQRYGWKCSRHDSHVRQDGSGYCYDHPDANHD